MTRPLLVLACLAGLARPPLAARPRALWPWINGNTELAEITRELDEANIKRLPNAWSIPLVDLPNENTPFVLRGFWARWTYGSSEPL